MECSKIYKIIQVAHRPNLEHETITISLLQCSDMLLCNNNQGRGCVKIRNRIYVCHLVLKLFRDVVEPVQDQSEGTIIIDTFLYFRILHGTKCLKTILLYFSLVHFTVM